MKQLMTILPLSATLLLGLPAGGCSDSDDEATGDGDGDMGGEGPGGAPGDGDGDGGATGDGDGDAVYATTTQVYDGESFTSYIVATDSLTGSLDLDDGIEIAGRAISSGLNEGGKLFVATDQSSTITRYDLQEDGTLQEYEEQFSFTSYGVTRVGEYAGQFYYVSAEKAYYFDGNTGNILVWNPEEMVAIEALSLEELVFEDELLTFGNVPVVHGDQVLMFPGWRTTDNTRVPSRAAVVSVNTETDEVTIVTDDRCGYVRDGVLADDGYVYMATEAYGAAVNYYDDQSADPPCLIRYDVQEQEFDDSFFVDITDWGEYTAGSLIVGPDNQAYILGLDGSDYEGMPHPRFLASAPHWSWLKLDLGDEPTVEAMDSDPTPGSVLSSSVGEEVLLPLFSGRDATSYHYLTDEGPGPQIADVVGLAFSTTKLR